MLLRRVIQHVNSQNWFAVVLDFLIVVVGIFVGLQVQAWSIERSERVEEREYLERLLVEVDFLIETNKSSLGYMSSQRKAVWLVFQSLNNCAIAEQDRDQFATGLYYVGRIIPPNNIVGTAQEMRSAGDFGLISESKVRDLLNELSAKASFDQELLSAISQRVSQSVAYLDQRIVINREFLGAFDRITWSELSINFDTLCKDPNVLGALTITRSIRQIYMSRVEDSIELLQKIRQAVLQALGQPANLNDTDAMVR